LELFQLVGKIKEKQTKMYNKSRNSLLKYCFLNWNEKKSMSHLQKMLIFRKTTLLLVMFLKKSLISLIPGKTLFLELQYYSAHELVI